MSLRIATWNMQALFPKKANDEKWAYLEGTVSPDVAVLTEANPGDVAGMSLTHLAGALGKGRKFRTIVATGDSFRAQRVTWLDLELDDMAPGSVVVCDIFRGDEFLVTVVGLYAPLLNWDGEKVKHGFHSSQMALDDLQPLFDERRNRRIVVAGDLNIWSDYVARAIKGTSLVDLVETTASSRPVSPNCVCGSPKPCRHIWTHNNGFKGKFQQIDFILSTPDLAERLVSMTGGPEAFPDIWEYSDHAPLIAEFDL